MNDDILDNADGLYFSEVENEDGLNVELNETLKSNLAGLIEARFISAEQAREYDEDIISVVFTQSTYLSAKVKSPESLLKSQRPKCLRPTAS